MRARSPGSTTRLDSQGDKIMHRVVYRNTGGIESIVMLHSINTQAGAGGERWYEMRLDGNRDPYLYQHSTYAPDNHYRWLGSPAIDRKGDIALAYSYGGGPYILPIATTLSAAVGGGRDEHQGRGHERHEHQLAPGRKVNIGTGATLETATMQTVGTAGADGTGIDLDRAAHDRPRERLDRLQRRLHRASRPSACAVGQRYTARQPGDPLNR